MGSGELPTKNKHNRNTEEALKQDLKLTAPVLGPAELHKGAARTGT